MVAFLPFFLILYEAGGGSVKYIVSPPFVDEQRPSECKLGIANQVYIFMTKENFSNGMYCFLDLSEFPDD